MTRPKTRLLQCLCLIGILTGVALPVSGQVTDVATRKTAPQLNVTGSGSRRYVPGHWGIVNAQVTNPGHETSVRCLSWFEGDPALQSGRDITVPRESIRHTWFSVIAPAADRSARSLELAFGKTSADGDDVAPTASRTVETETRGMIVPVSRPRVLHVNDGEPAEIEALDLFSAARSRVASGLVLLGVSSKRLPPVEEAWDIADVVILSGDRIDHDSQAQAALLTWVRRGGRMWIPLDLIDPDIVSDLLSDRLQMDVVNRTSLTSFRVVSEKSSAEAIALDLERPVEFVRVVVQGANITHRVDGWPAAFDVPFGRGRVTITTLGLPGWIVKGDNFVDQALTSPGNIVEYTPAAASLFSPIFSTVATVPFKAAALDEYVTSRIGYQTPARSTIAWLLGLHAALCLVVAGLLHRTGRPGWMLCAFPLLGGIAAAVLIVAGSSSRSQPAGQQTVQIIESEVGRSELAVSGALAFYSDADTTPSLGTESGAVFLPDRRGMEHARWRLMRSDLNHWQLQNVEFRPGVRTAQFSSRVTTDKPIRMTGTFDADGFSGHLETPFGLEPEDALIAHRTHVTLPVRVFPDGRVEPTGGVLPPREYLSESVINEKQTRRQRLYRELFRTEGRFKRIVTRPTLLFWTQPLDLKSGQLDAEPPDGSALFMVPVEIQRPPAGTTVRIPAPFIHYRGIPINGTQATPSFFSNSMGTWSEYPSASRITLRFQLPADLLPLAAERATLSLKITAPMRDVTIQAVVGNQATQIARYTSPVRVVEIDVDESLIDLDSEGGLRLTLSVGDVESASDASAPVQDRYWKVDWLQLEFHGRTL
jgi:hypothetical protein